MLTTADKAWVGGLISWMGGYASTRWNLPFITPEFLALLTGAVVYWVPNARPPAPR